MTNDPYLDRIFCADARSMASVPDGSVHLVVTSPPYNVAKDYTVHNDDLSLDDYLAMLDAVWRECHRVLVRGGRLCVNVANTDRKPYLSLVSLIDEQLRLGERTSATRWLHRGHIIWDKGASAGISTAWGSFGRSSNPTLRDVHEYITVWSKDQLRLDGGGPTGISGNEFVAWTRSIWRPEDGLKDLQRKIEAKLADARRRDKEDAWIAESIARSVWAQGAQGADESESIWSMTTETSVDHPAPFPEELPRRLMLLYTKPGDVVLDPFMGSGSTAVAAVMEGRHYVGYEISAEYCQIAEERVAEAKKSHGGTTQRIDTR